MSFSENQLSGIPICTMSVEDEFNLAYTDFRLKYNGVNVRDMPAETVDGGPYSDYMNILSIHARRNSSAKDLRIEVLHDVMQRYAECHRD